MISTLVFFPSFACWKQQNVCTKKKRNGKLLQIIFMIFSELFIDKWKQKEDKKMIFSSCFFCWGISFLNILVTNGTKTMKMMRKSYKIFNGVSRHFQIIHKYYSESFYFLSFFKSMTRHSINVMRIN